jgi:hypothetical protein
VQAGLGESQTHGLVPILGGIERGTAQPILGPMPLFAAAIEQMSEADGLALVCSGSKPFARILVVAIDDRAGIGLHLHLLGPVNPVHGAFVHDATRGHHTDENRGDTGPFEADVLHVDISLKNLGPCSA